MNEFDTRVLDLLDAFTPEPHRWPEWPDVLRRTRSRHMRRFVVAMAAAVAVLGTAAAVTAALGGFHAWLNGSPGKPAPKAEQEKFRSENEHSYAAFPKDTKLRALIRTNVDRKTYVLFGFRSGDSLCLRLKAVSLGHSISACGSAARLRHTTAPILPLITAFSFADKYNHPSAAVSFGIAADGVSRVVVHAVDADHAATIGGNAYLWVQNEPNSGQRALGITAVSTTGSRLTLPFENDNTPDMPARGPSRLEARIAHPTVGWYVRGEKRGVGLSQVEGRGARGNAPFDDSTRLIKPDPQANALVGLTGKWCLVVVLHDLNGPSESCDSSTDFWLRGPLNAITTGEYTDQFTRVNGVAADGVQRVVLFLADGQRQPAALRDNMFTTLVATAELPARIVGYDKAGRVVGVIAAPWFRPFQVPRGARKLHRILRVEGPRGAVAVASVGPPVRGYRCWRVDFSTGESRGSCEPPKFTAPSIWPELVQPAGDDLFVIGHTFGPIARVQLEFPNGDVRRIRPVARLFVIAVPRTHLTRTRQTAYVVGYTSEGEVIQRKAVVFKLRR